MIEINYRCIDDEHNTYECMNCGYIVSFEADGPFENGFDRCPSCGEKIKHREVDV